jgi:hypothetical protein
MVLLLLLFLVVVVVVIATDAALSSTGVPETFVFCATNPSIFVQWVECCNLVIKSSSSSAHCTLATRNGTNTRTTANLGVFPLGFSLSVDNFDAVNLKKSNGYLLQSQQPLDLAFARKNGGVVMFGILRDDDAGETNMTLSVL